MSQAAAQFRDCEGGSTTMLDELKQALVENLTNRGVLGKLKAQVRAEVFHTLEEGPRRRGVLHPRLSNDNLLINELVRDYLSYNGYGNALSVFMAESGQPNDRTLDRDFLRDELGLSEQRDPTADGKLPLLYGITHALRQWKNDAYSAEECCGDGSNMGRKCYDGCPSKGNGPARVAVCTCDQMCMPDDGSISRWTHDAMQQNRRSNAIGLQDPAPVLFLKRQEHGGPT